MLTPEREFRPLSMNPVDSHPPFIPPPIGSTHGGEGHYNPFPGAVGGGGDEGGFGHGAPWGVPPPKGTPYPGYHPLQPSSTSSGGGGAGWPGALLSPGGPPWGYTPSYGPPAPSSAPVVPSSAWGMPWGPPSPHSAGGGWAPNPNLTVQQPAPQGYSPFPGYTHGPQQFTPYTPGHGAPPPGTPFESFTGQPVTGGWFGGAEAPVRPVGGQGGWFENAEPRKKKKSHSGHGHRDGHDQHHYHHGHVWDTAMRRSTSQIEAPKRPILKRSASWGNSAGGHSPYLDPNFNYFGNKVHNPPRPPTPQTPGYAQYDHFDANNLSKRPRDWRPDFVARQAITALIPAVLGRSNSVVKDYSDPIKRTLHPLIAYKSPISPFYYDLRLPGFRPDYVSFEPILHRPANDIDHHQLALQPTCSFMRIFHPKLPWYIDVHQVHPNGITVIDVLSAIGNQMHETIRPRHFWNDELGDSERKMITLAFQDRVRNDPALIANGIVQVDFLGPKCVLEGFVRASKGMWEMKTRRPDE